MYVIAQYFGWNEIIRREILYLEFAEDDETAEVGTILSRIASVFADDSYGRQFMIWRVEQRGIGERMIHTDEDRTGCRGYGSFLDTAEETDTWFDPLRRDLENLDESGRRRLTALQHLLVDLVDRLDPAKKINPDELTRA